MEDNIIHLGHRYVVQLRGYDAWENIYHDSHHIQIDMQCLPHKNFFLFRQISSVVLFYLHVQ